MSTLDFRKVDVLKAQPFEAGSLPDQEKERLCRDLLGEFGVTTVNRVSDSGEMIHSCCLPYGAHKNGDASASASLNYKKLTYNCLGCGSSGGLLWFIATCRGEDTDSARKWLEDQTGSGPDEQSLASLLSFFESVYGAKEANRPTPIPKMSMTVLTPWQRIHPYLTDPPSEGGRGISAEAVVRLNVGYAEAYRTRLSDDTFIESPRIVIPHIWKGDLVGWQTRRLIKDGTPKYVSSPDFPKDTTLYQFDQKAPVAEVVESPMSVLVCADDGVHQEATFGAKVTDRQCALISIHRRVVLWMDNDDAGWKATKRVGDYLEPYSDVWVIDNPWNADPADLDREERTRLRAEPVPYSLWKPPHVLYCWSCKAVAHDGPCP